MQLLLDKVIKWKLFEGFAPDVCEGGAHEVVDERPDHREAGLPRRVDDAVQHTLCIQKEGLTYLTTTVKYRVYKFL